MSTPDPLRDRATKNNFAAATDPIIDGIGLGMPKVRTNAQEPAPPARGRRRDALQDPLARGSLPRDTLSAPVQFKKKDRAPKLEDPASPQVTTHEVEGGTATRKKVSVEDGERVGKRMTRTTDTQSAAASATTDQVGVTVGKTTTKDTHVRRARKGKETGGYNLKAESSERTSTAGGVSVGKDGAKISVGSSNSKVHQGQGGGSGTDGSVLVDEQGVKSVGLDHTRKTVQGDRTDETKTGVTADVREGKFGVSQNRSREVGDTKRGRTVTGGVDLREDGELEGASVGVGGDRTRTLDKIKGADRTASFNLGGGWVAKVTKPEEREDGQFQVSWTLKLEGNVGVSGGANASKGKGASVGLNASGEKERSGTILFKTAEEAMKTWSQGVGITDWSRLGERALGEGETRKNASSHKIGGDVTVTVKGVTVGGGVAHSAGKSAEETGGKGFVDVEIAAWKCIEANAKLGVILTGTYGYTNKDTRKIKVRFTTSEASGRRGYEDFKNSGALPMQGWTLVQTTLEKTRKHETGATLFGAGLRNSGEMTTSTSKDATGKVIEESDTGTRGESLTIPLIGKLKSDTSLNATKTAQGEAWKTSSTIDATYASDAHAKLAEKTNTHRDMNKPTFGPAASGKWEVEGELSNAAINRFLDALAGGGFRGGMLHGDLQTLAKNLEGKSRRTQRYMVAAFVKDKGDRGADAIENISGTKIDHHVKLEKDPYLKGLAGDKATKSKIARWRGEVKTSQEPDQLARSIRSHLSYQYKRRAALRDENKYTELPKEVREKEIARSSTHIRSLQGLLKTLKDNPPPKDGTQEDQQQTRDPTAQAPLQDGEQAVSGTSSVQGPVAPKESARDRWARETDKTRASCGKASRLTKYHKRIHNGSWATTISAKRKLGFTTFGGLYKADEHASYQAAEQWEKHADARRNAAESKYADSLGADDDRAVGLLASADGVFGVATKNYQSATRIYSRIRAQYQKTYPGAFEGYRKLRRPN